MWEKRNILIVQLLGFLSALELSSGKSSLGRPRLKVTRVKVGSDGAGIGSFSRRLEIPHQCCPGCFVLQCGHCLGWSLKSLEALVSSVLKVPKSDASNPHPERCVSARAVFQPLILLFPCQAVILGRSASWWLRTSTRSHWVQTALHSCRRSLIVVGLTSLPGGPLLRVRSSLIRTM